MTIDDLMGLVGTRPSKSTYERAERGLAIRAVNAFKIAHAVNGAFKMQGLEAFDVDLEVEYI